MAIRKYTFTFEVVDASGNLIPNVKYEQAVYGGNPNSHLPNVPCNPQSGVTGQVISVNYNDPGNGKLSLYVDIPAQEATIKITNEDGEVYTVPIPPFGTSVHVVINMRLKRAVVAHGIIVSGSHKMIHKFKINNKILTHIKYGNKVLTLIDPVAGGSTIPIKPPIHKPTHPPTFRGVFRDRDQIILQRNPNLAYPANAIAKEAEFNAITTTVDSYQFYFDKLTSISLPEVTTVKEDAFFESYLVYVYVPLATTIRTHAFGGIVNAPTTHVTMKSKFNTKSEKDNIFGDGNWDQITFTWV